MLRGPLLLLCAAACFARALPASRQEGGPQPPPPPPEQRPGRVVLLPAARQFAPRFEFSYLEPQFQVPHYGFEKGPFPRIQPQLLIYPGGAPPADQPFLLQPAAGGAPPPGNFLVPQPGPGVVLGGGQPGRPVIVAGYPKPAHIPPIEKDAEEVPTNPARVPPLAGGRKPEKLETFNEAEAPQTLGAGKAEQELKPGQRFFILNGQQLFSNYPLQAALRQPQKQPPFLQQQQQLQQPAPPQVQPQANDYFPLILRNSLSQNFHLPVASIQEPSFGAKLPENFVLFDQPLAEEPLFKSSLAAQTKDIPFDRIQIDNPFLPYQATFDGDNDAIILEAREQDQPGGRKGATAQSEDERDPEPTISQAQPAAVAIAGRGGVAAAGPRGNAFVGKGGVAVSSPFATAVAGPQKDAVDDRKNRKPAKKN